MDVQLLTPAWDISYKLIQERKIESKEKLELEEIFTETNFDKLDTLDVWLLLKHSDLLGDLTNLKHPYTSLIGTMSSAFLEDDALFINSLINGTACHRQSIWNDVRGWLKEYTKSKYSIGFELIIEKVYKIRIKQERVKGFFKVDEGFSSGIMYSKAVMVKFLSPMKIQLVIDSDDNPDVDLEFNNDLN